MTVQECIKYVKDHLEVRDAYANRCFLAKRLIMKPEGCVNHSVGVAQPSVDVFYKLMNTRTVSWGVNAIIGDFHKGEGRILLCMPYNGRPWGCGEGHKGSWNNTKIQWEVCEPAGHTYAGGTMINYNVEANQEYFDRMWKMLVCWNVYMVHMFNYPISGISDHAESFRAGYGSNHADMGQWLPKHGKSMDALRKEVQEIFDYTNSIQEDDDMDVNRFKELLLEYRETLQDNDAAQYSEAAREWAKQTGLVQGTSGEEFNGAWEDFMTREQFITVLYRFAKMMGQA